MIRIQQLKLPVTHTQEELEQKIRKTLKIGKHDLQEIELLRRSIDARKKSELKYVYQLDVKVKDENAVLGQIPGLVEVHVNINGLPSSNADLMLDTTFTDAAALKGYSTHPAHVAVADGKVRPYTKTRVCLDFEV